MRILVVDDDRHLREGLALLLEEEGHTCEVAEDGVDAWTRYQHDIPDLCILDVMMPRMSGLQLCHLLRQRAPQLPILLLTALDQDTDQVKGLDLGADDYITKPFNPQTLLARVRALQRRTVNSQDQEPQPLQCHQLTIDKGRMTASYQDKSMALTVREQSFLALMIRHKDLALSRDQIFDYCWGRDFIPNSRSLDQFVSTMRQKLEKQLGTPRFITTVHGMGYRCDSELLK